MGRIVSTAPSHIVTRYMRGRCWEGAAELSRKTGMELWGLRGGDGLIHHAFVADPEQDLAIDIRGGMRMSEVAKGCVPGEPEPIAMPDIIRLVGVLEPADLREARAAIRDHLHGLPARRRQHRPVAVSRADGPCAGGPEP